MQVTGMCRRWLTVVAVALVAGSYASRADAAIEIKSESGWSASFSGFLNLFMVDTFGPAAPAGSGGDLYSRTTEDNWFRVRTGFLPSCFAFNAEAPEWEGMKFKLRVGIYPQLNNSNTRTSVSPNIDWREFNLTVDGKFGQLLVGRAINLYQSEATLGDMSLFGVGIPGAAGAPGQTATYGWPTLGHIGFGYLYPAFGAQFRYTTPDFGGLKLAVAVSDPSNIGAASITSIPLFESSLTYSGKFDSVSLRAWIGGLFNRAWFSSSTTGPRGAVNGAGGSAGVGLGVVGLDVMASGFWGSGLGSATQLDGDSLDSTGMPVTTAGFLLQATYQLDKTKLGVNYGQNMVDQTTAQKAIADWNGLQRRSSVTAGVYHDLTKSVKVVAEYSWYQVNWYGGTSQAGNVLALGGFFFW
jgi:hypothetical protein